VSGSTGPQDIERQKRGKRYERNKNQHFIWGETEISRNYGKVSRPYFIQEWTVSNLVQEVAVMYE
jgi:methionine aminopeptidase